MENIKNDKRNDKALTEDPIWKTFDALPESIKDALISPTFESAIKHAASQNGAEEKIGDIMRTTEEVLLGILPIQRFVPTLIEKVGLSQEQAQKIGYEIRDKIFADVADDLSRLHRITSRKP